ncbi:MAG: NAD(P)H-hydrate dehydratase [Verrucomicrobiota bacterium]|nr:NAD(P)H-hydrate dehydratase [Verrucomicrobiota bacterium]
MKIISVKQMRHLDAITIDKGTPGEILMERAGEGVFYEILHFLSFYPKQYHQKICILTGKGNNAGDGYVIARLFGQRTDYPVEVYSVCQKNELQGNALNNAERLPESVSLYQKITPPEFSKGTVVIDALLGTGIKGNLRSPYPEWIEVVNSSHCLVVAIDIPSGLNGDTGLTDSNPILADLTVTMALPKKGLLLPETLGICGRIRTVDIGVDNKDINTLEGFGNAVFGDDVQSFLDRLPGNSHKGTQGTVNIVAGSRLYTGAPVLSAIAAARGGCGYVKLIVPNSIRNLLHNLPNSVILNELDDENKGFFTFKSINALKKMDLANSVIIFGPGVGRNIESLGVLKEILKVDVPVVIDADGLFFLEKCRNLIEKRSFPTIITPHPGEMRRIIEKNIGKNDFSISSNSERGEVASIVAKKMKIYVILKGRGTIIASPDGDVSINTSGNAALATAGSGDVLTGLIGAFIAQSNSPVIDALKTAVFIHGRTGELSPYGERALIADDIPALIGPAMRDISCFA